MVSTIEFVRMINIQKETIERYIKEGKLITDLEVPIRSKNKYIFKPCEKIQRCRIYRS